jgi:glycosyltransferase involved in cell wall biosynthesis
MKARGHHVSVTTLTAPTAYRQILAEHGIEVRSLEVHRDRKDFSQLIRALIAYRRTLKKSRPQIVHAHMVHANLFGRAASVLQAHKLICTIHNIQEGGRLRDLGYALSNWASDLDVTVSQAATRRFVDGRVLQRRTLTIPNGVEIPSCRQSRRVGSDGSGFKWLAVGRLEVQKDYHTLFSALARLPSATLTVVGDGSLRASLEALKRRLRIDDRVTLLETRADIADQFLNHDGYVLSSAWEGFGLALAEAMASGLPVVATHSGGPSEIVGEDGTCGLLVRPGSPVDLAAAMETVQCMSPDERFAIGGRGRDRIARLYSRDAMLQRWEATYLRVACAE